MRCLSIADAVKAQGIEPLFVTACEECAPVIKQRGFQIRLLTTDYREMMAELSQLCAIMNEPGGALQVNVEEIGIKTRRSTQISITGKKKSVILVDSYQVTSEYYRELRKYAFVVCLEDMGQPYPVDILINYNIYGESLKSVYESEEENKPQQLLLGTSYMPLRQEFLQDTEYVLREKVTDVMITTGGSDPFFASGAFADAFLQEQTLKEAGIRYHIISGPFNSHAAELKERYRNNSQVIIYENVKSMKEIMRQCDVVLTATGSTIYEVSALGIPMLVFYFAENQRQGAEEIERKTSVMNCGDFSKEPQNAVGRAVEALKRCVTKMHYREQLQQQEKVLVDGQGAVRIAKAIIEQYSKAYLR